MMKKRNVLFLLGTLSLLLSGCSFVEEEPPLVIPDPETGEETAEPTPAQTQDEHVHSFGEYSSNAASHWHECECGEVERGDHKFVLKGRTSQDCEHPAVETYECSICGYQKFVNGHELNEHRYSSRIIREATCQTPGIITFTCSVCGSSFTQNYNSPNAHHFVVSSVVEGVTNMHCDHEGCHETKQIIDASSHTQAEVNLDTLKSVGEVQLQHAAIEFDNNTLDELSANVTIAATPKTVDTIEVSLDNSVKEKLEGKQIIDFSLKDGEETVSNFAGSVKVTVPYELKVGESADSIAVWYLNDEGQPETIKGEYVNGNVSFNTTHFSYYAVVHLDPAEVCKFFGHEMVKGQKMLSTCTTHGFDDMVCRRCGHIDRTILDLANHDFELAYKVDPTDTEDGYVRYVCKNCEEIHDTILPRTNKDTGSFYLNLIQSGLSNDKYVHVYTSTERYTTEIDGYYGKDFEGEDLSYYTYKDIYSDRASSSVTALYKGYNYTQDGMNKYQSYSRMGSSAFYADMISYFPNIIKEDIQEIGEWFEEKYLIKSESAEGYDFAVDNNALYQTYRDFADQTLEVALKRTFGEEFYNKVLDFASNNYDKTVEEVIDNLSVEGYVVKEFYDAFVEIYKNCYGGNVDYIPALSDILTSNIKSAKLYDVIAAYFRGYLDFDDDTGLELDDDYVRPEQVPTTVSEAREFIDEYLEDNLFNILYTKRMNSFYNSLAEFKAEIDRYALELKNSVSYLLKTDAKGNLLSLSSTSQTSLEGSVTSNVDIRVGFDKAEVIRKIQRLMDRYEVRASVLNIGPNNFEWFVKPYKELYPGTNFEYRRNYNNERYDAIISTSDVTVQTNTRWDYELDQIVPVYKTGKLIIRLYQSDGESDEYYGYYRSEIGEVVQNRYGLGTRVAKGDYAVILNAHYHGFIRSFDLLVDEEGILTETYCSSENIKTFSYMYSFTDGKYYYTDGSYSYLDGGYSYRYELATKEEYAEYFGYSAADIERLPDDAIYYKGIDNISGYSYYGFDDGYYMYDEESGTEIRVPQESITMESYVITPEMDDAALEHYQSFRISYRITKDNVTTSLGGFYYGRYNDAYLNEDEFARLNEPVVVSYGNTRSEIVYKSTSLTCKKKVNWSISVASSIVFSGSFDQHFFVYEHTRCVESDEVINACYTKHWRRYYCDYCNKLRDEWYENDYHHTYELISDNTTEIDCCHTHHDVHKVCSVCNESYDYEYVDTHHTCSEYQTVVRDVAATATRPGYHYEFEICPDCGKYVNWSYGNDQVYRVCRHENYHFDGNTFICDDCGYTCETNDGQKPAFIYEQIETSDGSLRYSVFVPSLTNIFENLYLDDYYSFRLTAGYMENGQFVPLVASDDNGVGPRPELYAYVRRTYITNADGEIIHYFNYYEALFFFDLVFEAEDYAQLQEQASSMYSGEIVYAITAVAYDSGTVYYYVI